MIGYVHGPRDRVANENPNCSSLLRDRLTAWYRLWSRRPPTLLWTFSHINLLRPLSWNYCSSRYVQFSRFPIFDDPTPAANSTVRSGHMKDTAMHWSRPCSTELVFGAYLSSRVRIASPAGTPVDERCISRWSLSCVVANPGPG